MAYSVFVVPEKVYRCSGNAQWEPGAVVCRVAHSWIRFGSVQLPMALEENDLFKQLADYVIKHHYSHVQGALLLVLCTAATCQNEQFWSKCLLDLLV